MRQASRSHLLLVGDGQLREQLEGEVQERATPNVRFLGFRRDVPAVLAGSDAFVLPSKREGLPRAVLEAMAAGLPVVATDVWGNRDLVERGRNGLLVKVGDARGLGEALAALAGDSAPRRRMGEEGRTKVSEYALERVVEEMRTIYARYLERGVG